MGSFLQTCRPLTHFGSPLWEPPGKGSPLWPWSWPKKEAEEPTHRPAQPRWGRRGPAFPLCLPPARPFLQFRSLFLRFGDVLQTFVDLLGSHISPSRNRGDSKSRRQRNKESRSVQTMQKAESGFKGAPAQARRLFFPFRLPDP